MRVLALVYEAEAGPGVFAEPMASAGVELESRFVPDQGLPADPLGFDAIISLGGYMHPDHEDRWPWLAEQKRLLAEALERELPLLGVCLGAQLLAEAAGSPARRMPEPEVGWFPVEVTEEGASDPLIGPLAPGFEALEWHSYGIPLPAGAVALARSERSLQAFRIGSTAWGIQFHAEVIADDLETWVRSYESGESENELDLDWGAVRAANAARIESWNQLGRGLCGRFLETVAGRSATPASRSA